MPLSQMIGPADIYSDNRGGVVASKSCEVECISANHKDADLWIQVWVKVNVHKEQDLGFRIVRVKAHNSAKEKAKMTQQDGQIAMANDKADELAKGGATLDVRGKGSGSGSQANIFAANKFAATIHCEVEDLVDMEEMTQEMKQKPKWCFDF